MAVDYSYGNQLFADGLQAFLDYTEPNAFRAVTKEGIMPRKRVRKEDFEKRCIQRWAISELIDSITRNPNQAVEDTTYQLALKFLAFAQTASNPAARMVFEVAGDFIDKEVIGLFRNREGVYP